MNHQTAKIIAEAYRAQAAGKYGPQQARSLLDHSEVWEGVAKMIAHNQYPLGKQEAPHVS